MASTLKSQEVNVSEIVESFTAIIFAPLILPVAAAVKQPVVQTVIRGGITLSERCKEAVGEVAEVFENVAAEVNTDLIQERRQQLQQLEMNSRNGYTYQIYFQDDISEVSRDVINVMSDLNEDVGRLTNGVADLRLLVPLGLGLLAMRQFIDRGLQLEEIPWYALAWYAFDAFVKLNLEGD
ncbi:MAG: DUF5132 domain-containing protein [Goleter apudmare HA4340-LM2]|jgi:hypothetical protein|nr:DUF5132 domain-containing protein [Goleter apudmare HA4340-LM2]